MIYKLIRSVLKLDENDREIEEIKDHAQKVIEEATIVIRIAGQMQQRLVKKTTTYYIAKAMGAIT